MKVVTLALLALCANALESSVNPVTKVVELIKEMKANIQADGEAEQKLYDKYACWCEKTTARKSKAIVDGKDKELSLTNTILELKGSIATLSSEILTLNEEIKDNLAEQKSWTDTRMAANADYMQEKAYMEKTLGALHQAVTVLHKAGNKPGMLLKVKNDVIKVVLSAPDMRMSTDKVQGVKALVQEASSYAPQSGKIQGILRDMYKTFAKNLMKANSEEARSQKTYDDYMAELVTDLKAAQKTLGEKEAERADDQKSLADAESELDTTQQEFKADTTFFNETATACTKKTKDWNIRKDLRSDELKGIDEALKILTDEKNRKMFTDAATTRVNTYDFVQLTSTLGMSEAKQAAWNELVKVSKATHSPQLAAIAAQMVTDPTGKGRFDTVIKAIKQMQQTLADEEADDIDKRDTCIENEHQFEKLDAKLVHKIGRAEDRIEKLTADKKATIEERDSTIQSIKDTQSALKDATKQRENENGEHVSANTTDTNAVNLLEQAIGALSKFYKDNKIDLPKSLLQRRQEPVFEVSEDQAPDTGDVDKEYSGRKAAGGSIISMLRMIQEDLSKEIVDGIADEKRAVTEFKALEKEMNDSIDTYEDSKDLLNEQIADLKSQITDTDKLKTNTETGKDENQTDWDSQEKACKWINANFETRLAKRKAEKEGLLNALSFLGGAGSAPALLQRRNAAPISKH